MPRKNVGRWIFYWKRIGQITDENGSLKYPQLAALVKCILPLSHGKEISNSQADAGIARFRNN